MSKRIPKVGWIVLVYLLSLSLVIFPACAGGGGGGGPIPYKNDGIFTEMVIGLPETLDYAAAYDTSSSEMITYVYEPLLAYNGTSIDTFIPVLATSWAWNDTTATWTFTIRSGVHFQEGGNLTPEDVEYSFERMMIYDRAGGPDALILRPLVGVDAYADTNFTAVDESVDVVGNDTVAFHLSNAAYKLIFLQTIAQSFGVIVDKEWCVANGDWDGTEADAPNFYQVEPTYLWTHMNGTGPWKFVLWESENQIKFEKWDGYWGTPAPFDQIVAQLVTEWSTRKAALLAGDADYVDVDRQYIHQLDNITDLTVYSGLPALQSLAFYMVLNISSSSPYIGSGTLDGNGIPGDFFADPMVRKGFAYAMDYDTFINDAYLGEGIRCGLVVQGLYGYNSSVPMYNFNLTQAKYCFEHSGFGNLSAIGFKFVLLYNAGNQARKTACEILQKNLLAISSKFQVSIQPLSWSTGILPLIKTQDATAYIIGWGADFPHADNFIFPFMDTAGTYAQFQSYGNSTIDALIEAALLESDPVQQLKDYYDLQVIYYDDCPGFPLIQPTGRRYFTKYISGFYFNPMIPGNAGPLYYMSKSES
jgi:peptide/nickel transport system substrate-binding protein